MRALASAVVMLCLLQPAVGADFALRDGDTVVFLGDSITAARGYTKVVEHYALMRFPDRKVRFVNAGKGGDTASGALARLDKDVFSCGATVVTVAFGINDIGWGMKADAEHKERYLGGIRQIVEQCRARGIRPIICSPAITAEDPGRAEEGFLQKMTDEGLALARSLGAETIDLQRGMREVQRRIVTANANEKDEKKHTRLHVDDGVHLNDLGQLAMAFAMLKGLGAPADVSRATIDARKGTVSEAEHCTITGIATRDGAVEFTRLDEGLPLNLGPLSGLNYRWIPIPEELNRYMLQLTGLPSGKHEILAGGRSLGVVTSEQLERGINLSSMTADPWEPGGPWDAQSMIVKELVDARDKLWMAGVHRARFLSNHPAYAALENESAQEEIRIVTQQRAIARPYPYRFQVRRVEGKN